MAGFLPAQSYAWSYMAVFFTSWKTEEKMSRISVCAMAIVAALVVSGESAASSLYTLTLLQQCKADKKSAQWGYCVGYIVGVADKMADFGLQRTAYGDGTTPRPRESLCPDGDRDFDPTVMVPLFVTWVEHHPEQAQFPASETVGYALQGKWPCKF